MPVRRVAEGARELGRDVIREHFLSLRNGRVRRADHHCHQPRMRRL